MIPKVSVHGAQHLPRTVTKENLKLAAVKIGECFGLRKIRVVIKNETVMDCDDAPLLASVMLDMSVRKKANCEVFFYAPEIRRYVHAKKGRTLRKLYARYLAHELAHARQNVYGTFDSLPEKLKEREADAMERVFWPIALECLRA